MQFILKFKPFVRKLLCTAFVHRNSSQQFRYISGYKRSRHHLDNIVDTTEIDSSIISDKESPLHKPDFNHNEHYEFGQRIESSNNKPKIPFSIKKKNSYVDIFKKHRFSLTLEHKFLSVTGKLLPSHVVGLSSKSHKAISKSIRRARCMGLMPYMFRKPIIISEHYNKR